MLNLRYHHPADLKHIENHWDMAGAHHVLFGGLNPSGKHLWSIGIIADNILNRWKNQTKSCSRPPSSISICTNHWKYIWHIHLAHPMNPMEQQKPKKSQAEIGPGTFPANFFRSSRRKRSTFSWFRGYISILSSDFVVDKSEHLHFFLSFLRCCKFIFHGNLQIYSFSDN